MSQSEIYEAAAGKLLKDQQAFFDANPAEKERLLFNAFRHAYPQFFPSAYFSDPAVKGLALNKFQAYLDKINQAVLAVV